MAEYYSISLYDEGGNNLKIVHTGDSIYLSINADEKPDEGETFYLDDDGLQMIIDAVEMLKRNDD